MRSPRWGDSVTSALVQRFETYANLTNHERYALEALSSDYRTVEGCRDIIREGERPEHIHLIVDGWAIRYKSLPAGNRQITAVLLPGDFVDLRVAVLRRMDHSVRTVTRCQVAYIKPETIEDLTSNHSKLASAFLCSTLVGEANLRSWLVSIGRRDAYERLAHLICELHARLKLVGLVRGSTFDLPLTQEQVGDATGLTAVHINRMLQRLRAEKLIDLRRNVITVPNINALRRAAGFDPAFLHMERID